MITTDQFLARAEREAERRSKALFVREERLKELVALAVLTGMDARLCPEHDRLVVTDVNGRIVAFGPVDEVLAALVGD